jgi:hypothetical protein
MTIQTSFLKVRVASSPQHELATTITNKNAADGRSCLERSVGAFYQQLWYVRFRAVRVDAQSIEDSTIIRYTYEYILQK